MNPLRKFQHENRHFFFLSRADLRKGRGKRGGGEGGGVAGSRVAPKEECNLATGNLPA